MGKRRKIRETAVQLLYCTSQRSDRPSEDLRGPFWRLVTEPERRRLFTATLRAILHAAREHPKRREAWSQRLPATRATVAAAPGTEPLLDAIDQADAAESDFAAALDALRHLNLDGNDAEITPRLETAVGRFFAAHDHTRTARRRFLETAEDFPALRPATEPLAGAARKLDRISQRIETLRHPENLPDSPEFARLREAHHDLDGLREAAEQRVDQILANLESIDARLEAAIENFSPERIDPVDRSILRLATWEILSDPEIPTPVAINEAVEIAKRFGNTESARFVNGVLDRIAKSQ